MLRFEVPAKVIITLPNAGHGSVKEIDKLKNTATLTIEQHINNMDFLVSEGHTIAVRIHMGKHDFKGGEKKR